jgi:uncharacterized protein (TIGR02246 family)
VSEQIERQVRTTIEEFVRAWDAHDVAALAACWTDGGSVVDPWGRFAAGREAVTELLTREHGDLMRESSYRVDALRIRPLSETSAVIECDAVIENALAPNGKRYELAHRVDAVLVADGERWRFISLHPSFARAGR